MLLIGKMKKRKTGGKEIRKEGRSKRKRKGKMGGKRKNNKLNILHVQCKKHYHFYFIKEKTGLSIYLILTY